MQLQFSNTTTKLAVIQACEDYCALGDTGITANAVLLKTFTRYANRILSMVWTWIFFSYGGIKFDDSNQTDLPSATDTLTADKRIYANPAGATALSGVAIKDAAGQYYPLSPITPNQIQEKGFTIDSFMSTSGTPQFYMPLGESVYIFPASNVTRSTGYKNYYDRGMLALASTDTTKTMGFDVNFHEVVPIGASIDWMKINKPESRTLQEIKLDFADYEVRIKKFYRQKFEQMFPPRMTVRDGTLDAM